jgi:hypothetical protein
LASTFAFKFKLRHYIKAEAEGGDALSGATGAAADGGDGSDGGAAARAILPPRYITLI